MSHSISLEHFQGEQRTKFLNALGIIDKNPDAKFVGDFTWPPPNHRAIAEKTFWSFVGSYGMPASAWAGTQQVGSDWASVTLFFSDQGALLDGGYAVLHFYSSHNERVEYFSWRACDHVFETKNLGNCYNQFTCKKCSQAYTIDSSD